VIAKRRRGSLMVSFPIYGHAPERSSGALLKRGPDFVAAQISTLDFVSYPYFLRRLSNKHCGVGTYLRIVV
jgi:hypothetical protein